MILDFNPGNGVYVIKVPRTEKALVRELVDEYGLDFSKPDSRGAEAVLFTREPYAACPFANSATPLARAQLLPLLSQIEASRAADNAIRPVTPIDRELWPFQRASLAYAMQRRATLIGDEPGLGKTPMAITFANQIQAERILVVCPAGIRLQWIRRIREWTTMTYPFSVHPILKGSNGVHPTANWTVVSYDLARVPAIGRALAANKYDLAILDEIHYAKTIEAKRTRSLFGGGASPGHDPIVESASRVLGLSGTPLPNRPREAYTVARALCFDAIDWMSEDAFKFRFNPSKRIERIDPVTGRTSFFIDERSGRHAELQARLRANFMVRHLKREVMPQLKLPVFDLIQLETTGPVLQALKAESLLRIDPSSLEGANVAILGQVSTVRRMMGVALAPQIADYISMLIDGGEEKLTLFAWHIEVLDILEKALRRHGLVRIDGNTSTGQKQERIDTFIKEPGCRIILGNLLSMGTGTDGLQEVCYHALIAEPDWSPGPNIQAFDRLDRGGQRNTVQGEIFVAPGSFAERVLATALNKLRVLHSALDKEIEL